MAVWEVFWRYKGAKMIWASMPGLGNIERGWIFS